ncbi:hypothetical protein KIN20_000914 [Parelaphostrongylus tenuis]|uniref:Uncharacterized protein n=1 Tax=Parelaphostrongylus tenuis TaxID=148309 RepID=A0AAD5LX30_PARTN|nr:hypothetical protein KIN20_000914 [Parelaphostrongylus tenuis]
MPGSRAESLRAPVSCLWCFSELQTSPLQTHAHHSLHRPPPRTQTPDHLPDLGPHLHRAEHFRDPASLLPACPRCYCDRTPRSPPAHQPTPAQTEYLLSSPTSPHMEMKAAGAAQGGLPVADRPGVASSRLTGITLRDLLEKDLRHPG